MNRDTLIAEQNILLARAADFRNADGDTTDELLATDAKLASIAREIAVIDARDAAPAKVEVVSTRSATVGDDVAASGIRNAPIGSSLEVEGRDIFTDPFGGNGAQPSAPADYTPGIAALPYFPPTFLDLVPVVPTSSDSVTYYKQTGFVSAAAKTGALGTYDRSELTWEKVSTPVEKHGHAFVVAEETLADEPAVAALINREGVRGLRDSVESLLVTTVLRDAQTVTGTEIAATIRTAKTAAEVVALPADLLIVTPQLREQLDLAAAQGNNGVGIYGNGPTTLFGLRIVTSYQLPAGADFVVGSTQGTRLRTRTGVEVASTNSHEGLFLKDAVALKVRQRVAVEVTHPEAWVKGTIEA
jgi:HK97 family phage major capsid protein